MLPAARRLFIPLLGVVFPQAFMLTALAVYLPTFMTQQGASLWMAGAALSIWELTGIAGALLGGTLSDRVGRKTVLVAAMASSSLLMFVFLNVSGWWLVPVLLALGFTSLSSTPVMLAMVQEGVSHNRAMANGLFMSMTFLVRPLAAFIIGLLGDNFGLHTSFYIATVVALLAIPMIYFLPHGNEQKP